VDSAQLMIVNVEVFCLLGLLIPCLAVAIHILLRRKLRTGWRMIGSLCLILIAIWCLNTIQDLVVTAQEINPECVGHSVSGDCGMAYALTQPEEEALLRADIVRDTLECVAVPTIVGVCIALFILRRAERIRFQ
jgi:hypothetical protein